MLAANYPLRDIVFTTTYVALVTCWLMLVFHVMVDTLRSADLRGYAKASWIIAIILLPLVGTLAYLVIRGSSMHQRDNRAVEQRAIEEYIRTIAATKE